MRIRAGEGRMAGAKAALVWVRARPRVVPLDQARGAAILQTARENDCALDLS
ncbi:hypothetical protein [Methylobacterium variabile]|uniref:hypothetical protein n=1 Tax=Methylobacterium variabile TaxID=298794 RepID=UPI0012EE70A0|nr:hypothetical protein [Methylobacterium variabile]